MATSKSSSAALKNVLIVIAVILAMGIAFFMGRATAPQIAAPETDGTNQAGQQDSAEDTAPNPEAPEERPQFAESQTDPELIKRLQEQIKREEGDPRAIGSVDAPVVMVSYEDFSCPMCTVFFEQTFPELQDLIDSGDLRIEFRDLVIFPNYGSDHAARASRAAANQGLFWEFVTTAYGQAGAGNHPTYSKETVLEIAKTVGVPDMAKFEADYESDEVKEAVNAETQHGMYNLGITGTPFFIVNNAVVTGAQPTPYFLKTIEKQLEEAK
ncbi:MAG: thioredoxin domain-containing protein [Actinomycetaceae bacterium]|nr:thioredoxin domain-containing protein [Actinomycetaceae bacterium]